MTTSALTPLFEGGSYFECPRWHDGRWWVSDFYRHTVFSYDADGTETKVLEVEHQPSGLGWLPDGDLLIVSMRNQRLLRVDGDGKVSEHADLSDVAENHINDMVVDGEGRAYVGSFGFDLMGGETPVSTSITRVDPDGTVTKAATDLWFPNGMVVTEDGTLVVAETLASRLTAFDIDGGELRNRRVWAQPAPAPEPSDTVTMLSGMTFAPDGICLDAEGHVWAANAVGRGVVRVAEDGGVVDEIALPEGLSGFACVLGGEDGRTLLVCAAPDFYEEARSAAREGVLLQATVDVPAASQA